MSASRKRSQSSPHRRPKRSWRPDKPYNEIPLLPPKVDLETKAILKQCIRGQGSAGRVEGSGGADTHPFSLNQHAAVARGSGQLGN